LSPGTVSCRLNGFRRTFAAEDRTLLLDAIRELGLTGAKPSCEMEVCGTCTVLLDGLPVSACTTLAVEVEGRSVTTVEGLARQGRLSEVQQAFLEHSAFQCGYCTPGMILAAESLLAENPAPSPADVRRWLDGNICRCTGYRSIQEAVLLAAARRRGA
jgi:aerobic-type carbon monoxide dehydrogenase small subunit (CoxS/CutS family)